MPGEPMRRRVIPDCDPEKPDDVSSIFGGSTREFYLNSARILARHLQHLMIPSSIGRLGKGVGGGRCESYLLSSGLGRSILF